MFIRNRKQSNKIIYSVYAKQTSKEANKQKLLTIQCIRYWGFINLVYIWQQTHE